MTGTDADLLSTARAALAAGLCVIPAARDASKAPWPDGPQWTKWKTERPSAELITRWFGATHPYPGLGLVCGAVSGGLEMLELEGRAIDEGLHLALLDAAEQAGLLELVERVADGYQEYTPTGGLHWLYRCEGIPGATPLARRPATPDELAENPKQLVKVLIETRGEGGFTIIAPSNGTTHPNGGAWELAQGGLATIATITPEERAELHRLCALFDRMPDRAAPTAPRSIEERLNDGTPGGGASSRPGDVYNERTTWADLLEPRGWATVYAHGSEIAWRRPGKDRGVSATTNHLGTDRLKVFSSSTPFDTNGTYDRFGAYALLEHGGDYKEAAKALGAAGYGTPPMAATPRASTLTEWPSDSGRTADALADGFRNTDSGNADRFVAAVDGRARYVHAWGRWIVYDECGVWKIDTGDAMVTELAKRVARGMFNRAVSLTGGERDALWKAAKRGESSNAISSMIRLARGVPGILVDHQELDTQPYLLNVVNGTVDLRTGELCAHNPDDLLTVQAPTVYDAGANAPLWLACLLRWQPDPEMRTYLQEIAGSGAVGRPVEHLFVNLGPGGNGKSKFYGAIAHVLGDYVIVPHKSLLTVQRHEQHDTVKADLFGARLAVASETDTNDRLDEAKVKELTGGDLLTARRMREDPWKFRQTHTMVMHTNHRPQIRGVDEGIWRRIRLIPWDVTIPLAERDDHLADKLADEAPGILNWILDGVHRWHQHGFKEPRSVGTATAGYRSSQDALAGFLEEWIQPVEGHRAAVKDLVKAYDEWCESSGENAVSKTVFGLMLQERGFTLTRDRRYRVGLRLLDTVNARPASDTQFPTYAHTQGELTGEAAQVAHADQPTLGESPAPPPDDETWEL